MNQTEGLLCHMEMSGSIYYVGLSHKKWPTDEVQAAVDKIYF